MFNTSKVQSPLPLSSIALSRICNVLFFHVWKLKLVASKSENVNAKENAIENSIRKWIDINLNIGLRTELLTKVFYHQFDFDSKVDSEKEIDNDNNHVDSYFTIWRTLFKVLYHPCMKSLIIPDVKSIIVDRMYLKMQTHLNYHQSKLLDNLINLMIYDFNLLIFL